MNKEEFIKECKKIGIEITDIMLEKLDIYFNLLVTWNKKFNLTTILEEKSVYLKHFYDSLCLVRAVDLGKKQNLCDIGTGAGFPGVVLKIVFENLNVTLVESNNKKCVFLNEVIKELNLENITVHCNRAEDFASNNREKFDIITTRAVASLRIICELAIPMLKLGGNFAPLKGHIGNEIAESDKILKELNSHIENVVSYVLPIESSSRNIPIIIKDDVSPTKYPRNYSKIVKTPL